MYNLCPNGVKTRFISLIETNHHRFECGASIMALLLLYTNQSLIAKYTYMYCCTIKILNMFEWKKKHKVHTIHAFAFTGALVSWMSLSKSNKVINELETSNEHETPKPIDVPFTFCEFVLFALYYTIKIT